MATWTGGREDTSMRPSWALALASALLIAAGCGGKLSSSGQSADEDSAGSGGSASGAGTGGSVSSAGSPSGSGTPSSPGSAGSFGGGGSFSGGGGGSVDPPQLYCGGRVCHTHPLPDVTACCTADDRCGFDYDGALASGDMVQPPDGGQAQPAGCQVDDQITIDLSGGQTTGTVVGSNGELIDLEPACGGAYVEPFGLTLPGCCRQDGLCGSSTHPVAGFENAEVLCAGPDDLEAILNPDGGSPSESGFTVTAYSVGTRCTYDPAP